VTEPPRRANHDDLPALREIIRAAYAPYLARLDRPPAPMVRDMRQHIENGQLWVIGRPIAGLICLVPEDDSLLVENVAVHPAAQGAGLGRRLMEFAEWRATCVGIRRVVLYTNEVMTENLAMYGHLGFREVDRRIEDGYHRVFMERLLDPS
jgi:GNAT superfamily N-acetyltransferase